MSFFGELNRRNVFRVAIAYTVVAWLVAQVAELALDSFGSPEWVMKTLLLLLVIGLPIALVFAWAFELTPEGVKREKNVNQSTSITSKTGPKIGYIIIGVLVVALSISVSTHQWTVGSDNDSVESQDAAADNAGQSIAVLPFVNMSDDADNEYFSDGISEELLNVLVRVEGLHVASRTSSFAFKGKDTSIPMIAESLGVAHILEGSVRKAGDTVRVTAQLIDARTDKQLWSETYDRKLEDIFAIQDEISAHIVDALKIALGTGSDPVPDTVQRPTSNLIAYEDYLRGRYLWRLRGEDNIRNAIQFFEQATGADPLFARAWSSLAAAQITLPTYADASRDDYYAAADRNARRALALDDTLAEAYAVLASLAGEVRHWGEAEELYRQAILHEPKNSTSYAWYGEHLLSAGRADAALESALKAYDLDPLHPGTNVFLGEIYMSLGDSENADKYNSAALELGHIGGLFGLAQLRLVQRRFPEALEMIRETLEEYPKPENYAELYIAAHQFPDRVPGFIDYIDKNSAELVRVQFLWDFILLDRLDLAYELISDPDALSTVRWLMLWRSETAAVRRDPRFEKLIQDAGLVEYWDEYGWPNSCQRVAGKIVCQ
jgi:TolB-like protein